MPGRAAHTTSLTGPAAGAHRNEVVVAGRLSAPAERRELPSGDEVMTWRLVVERPVGSPGQAFDVLDCSGWNARVRRGCAAWRPGDVIEVRGALRRRFWRSPGGALQSRCDVEVSSATRVATGDGQITRRRRPA